MNMSEYNAWMAREDVQKAYAPVKVMQGVLLEMMQALDRICTENGLRYYLFYGTQLGAFRHQGFLPWDDDADVVMPREDYEKLLHLPKEKIPSGYFVQSPYSEKYGRFCFAKLRRDGTTCICKDHRHIRMHQGIFVDIFPFDEPARGCRVLMWWLPRVMDRVTAFTSANLPRKISILRPVQWVWQKVFTPSFFARMANAMARLLSGSSGIYMSTFCTNRTTGERKGWDKTLFDPPRKILFEGVELNVPNKSEQLLDQRFGNWHELPPEKYRWPVHGDGGVIDVNKDYREYLR